MAPTYDFIIVGGGTSGCLLAHRLSTSAAKPSVLLLEAGGQPSGQYLNAPFHRYMPSALRPDLDHGHVSEPELALNGRQITYTRGKGLGGSSILNFGVYLYGSKEDYERWGSLVGDDDWKWDSVKKSFHEIENYDYVGSKEYQHLADPSKYAHGRDGKLKVGLPDVLEKGVVPQMEALAKEGEKINLDPNSGDPVGMSVFPYSYSRVGRSTSAGAFLANPPSNMEIWTDAVAEKLLVFEGDRVVGVVTADGRQASATKETILTAGSIDTPKLLLLNGIGPASDLSPLNIPIRKDLAHVGKHLQDHVLAFMSVEVDGAINDRYSFESNEALVAEAQGLWEKDQSGQFALQQSVLWGGFMKLAGLPSTPEFLALPDDLQTFLSKDAVPTFEFINNCLLWPPGTQLSSPDHTYMTFIAFLMNPQSEGEVTLRSTNPDDKPVIKLNYLTHPYDKVAFRQAIQQTYTKVMENPIVKPNIKKTLCAPASMSDADVDAFAADNASTVWHACGTVKMGKSEKDACVDSSGRVFGIKGLRVADLSVAPLMTNNHTQATAYLVGQKMSEKIVREYGLDGSKGSGETKL
ncbi:alcohol oxidase [Setomelanomma holmii]|uniref:Alcohol oxidase n=1 Tax=Setomelanomma holmii TaxID=210430 RepID=A0A9P4H481_9PLEO|nr:alcohol oxidase [Setomelanomma holmii]